MRGRGAGVFAPFFRCLFFGTLRGAKGAWGVDPFAFRPDRQNAGRGWGFCLEAEAAQKGRR